MSVTFAPFRPRLAVWQNRTAEDRERWVRRRVGAVWGLLFFNVLDYTGTLVHIPSIVGKGLTQGSLPLALLLALTLNRKVILRPNLFLCLVSLLALETILTSMQPQYLGTVYRTFRYVEFAIALWLLTPWWGRRDLLLVRCHLKAMLVVLGSVLMGLLIAPGKAFPFGRLSGDLWDIPATQVAHYSAVTTGLVVVLWFCGMLRGKLALIVVVVAGSMLILTHTRTALVGLVAGILVAGLSLFVAKARVRKLFAAAGAMTTVAIVTVSGFIATWLARGEGTQGLTNLTGRTKVWGPLLAFPRDRFHEIFGFGLSNSSFDGLPIDGTWFSTYEEHGLFGVAIGVMIVFFLLVTAYFQPRGVRRALALFLVTYCLIASFTEDGFIDPTPYLLELTLAASLLVPYVSGRRSIPAES